MRTAALALCLALLASRAPAQDAEAAAVVRRAIEAAGGAERLAKFPAGRFTATGTLFADGATYAVTAEFAYQVPGRYRATMRLEPAKGPKLEVLSVVNGNKAKYAMNGSPVPVTDPAAKELRAAMAAMEIGQLAPLLADKRFALRVEKVPRPDPKLAWVTAATKGAGEFRLGFDRAGGHLVRLVRKGFDPSTGKDADQEQVFSDYKSFDGLARPTKATTYKNGEKTLELTTEKFAPLESVDPKEFAAE